MKTCNPERLEVETLPKMPCSRDKEKSGEYCRSNLAWLVEVYAPRNRVSVRHAERKA
jgi:hypothetical protein